MLMLDLKRAEERAEMEGWIAVGITFHDDAPTTMVTASQDATT